MRHVKDYITEADELLFNRIIEILHSEIIEKKIHFEKDTPHKIFKSLDCFQDFELYTMMYIAQEKPDLYTVTLFPKRYQIDVWEEFYVSKTLDSLQIKRVKRFDSNGSLHSSQKNPSSISFKDGFSGRITSKILSMSFYKHGKLHNLFDAALINLMRGQTRYYIDGENYTREKWEIEKNFVYVQELEKRLDAKIMALHDKFNLFMDSLSKSSE